jgi:hypothetical protein
MTTQTVPLITLNNGVEMPALGLGVFQSPPAETIGAVESAIASGTGSSTPQPPTATSARSATASAAPASTAPRSL